MVLRSESAAIQSGPAQNSFETAAEHLSLLRRSVRRFPSEMPVNCVVERGLGVDLKFCKLNLSSGRDTLADFERLFQLLDISRRNVRS
jgi:hypothetical protein